MLLKISAVCLGAIALTTSVDAADPQNVLDCETNYVRAASQIDFTTDQRCEELVTLSKCLGQFAADDGAENKLFEENSKACEPFWNTLDEPTLRTARSNLDMTVDDAKEINFHRHRRETVSVFTMNERITKLMADVESLTTANADLKQAADDQKTDLENKLAAKSDELDQKNAALETKLTDAVDTAKEALEDSVDDLSDKVDQSKSDTAAALDKSKKETTAALDQSKKDAAIANAALEKKISGSVTDKLKPFEGTEVALTSLKRTYHSNPKIPVYRVARFKTHQGNFGWFDGNDNNGYGGIHPSQWTDGNYRADQMNADVKYLQRLFTQKETANKYGANICSAGYDQRTSTTGLVCGALFRIKNTGTSTIRWSPAITMTSYHGWSETASISLNGNNLIGNRDCNHMCRFTPSMNVPANSQKNRISTVIFMSTGSHAYGHYNYWRATLLLFRDNSLALPNGLEFVDDLDTITGSWKK